MEKFKTYLLNTLNFIWKLLQELFKYFMIGARHILRFLNAKKHLYIVPLFYLLLSAVIIIISIQIYQRYISIDYEDTITMDFSNIGEVSEESALELPEYNLNGLQVVIDPGHGGYDPGAISSSGELEENIVYEYADALRNRLENSNAEVILTRGYGESAELNARAIEGDVFISLHSDTFEDPSINGFTVHYAHDFQISFAESIVEGLTEYSPMYARGIRENGYQVVRQIDYPGVLVELGYLSNPIDDYILYSYEYKDEIVEGLIKGIALYAN